MSCSSNDRLGRHTSTIGCNVGIHRHMMQSIMKITERANTMRPLQHDQSQHSHLSSIPIIILLKLQVPLLLFISSLFASNLDPQNHRIANLEVSRLNSPESRLLKWPLNLVHSSLNNSPHCQLPIVWNSSLLISWVFVP